jgi:hypothetical protein
MHNPNLLSSEKNYSELAAKQILNQINRSLDSMRTTSYNYEEKLDSITSSYPTDLISYNNIFDIPDKQVNSATSNIYYMYIFKSVFRKLILIGLDEQTQKFYIKFYTTDHLASYDNKEHNIVFVQDQNNVSQQIKNTIEQTIVFFYNLFLSKTESDSRMAYLQQNWINWRKEQLKFENLTHKLPELRGIF